MPSDAENTTRGYCVSGGPAGLRSTPDKARIAYLEAENEKLRSLLARYRDETPLGHQPHMAAHEVDKALGR